MQTPTLLKKKISLQDFQIKRIIGKGSYGDVFLVIKDYLPYAMKEIIKRKLHRQKKQYQAMVQRQVLRVMKHPGIIKLKYAFQDKNKLYFVMEYCQLGQFVRFLKEYVEYFTEQLRKFYVAEIINILQYLHTNGITHRDLKPQNLLLSDAGHLKLIDFGTSQISDCKLLSKEFRDQIQKQKENENSQQEQIQQQEQPQQMMSPRKRRSTFVGTSYYISPQLLEHNMCEPPSDLWASGCILYQLYYLETPFKDSTQYGVFEKIKAVQLQFPKVVIYQKQNDLATQQAIDLIKKLLIKNPQQRLGCGSRQQLDYKHLKQHPYFQGINVDTIYSQIPPDIGVKKFTFQDQQFAAAKLKDFYDLALKVLNSSQQKIIVQNSQSQILVEGLLEKRQFPFYQNCYLRVYKNYKAKLIKIQRPQLRQQFQLYAKNPGQQQYQAIKLIDKQSGKFWIELKDRSKDIFKSKDFQKWIDAIKTLHKQQ